MVKVSRPIWISRINRRMSIRKFRENIGVINQLDQDYSRIVKSAKNPLKDVYEVTVDTWSEGEKKIWVSEELAEVTGEMYTRFMEQQIMNIDDDDDRDFDETIVNEGTFSDFIAIEQYMDENGSDDGDNSADDACNLSTMDYGETLNLMNSTMVQEDEENQKEQKKQEEEGKEVEEEEEEEIVGDEDEEDDSFF